MQSPMEIRDAIKTTIEVGKAQHSDTVHFTIDILEQWLETLNMICDMIERGAAIRENFNG